VGGFSGQSVKVVRDAVLAEHSRVVCGVQSQRRNRQEKIDRRELCRECIISYVARRRASYPAKLEGFERRTLCTIPTDRRPHLLGEQITVKVANFGT
jgi:hypothetical protein